MVSLNDIREVVPFGRRLLDIHPQKEFRNNVVDSMDDQLLIGAMHNIHLDPTKEVWRIRASESSDDTEEIYICDKTVVWSKHFGGAAGQVLRAFTVELPVLQAVWFKFSLPEDPDNNRLIPDHALCVRDQSGLCIVESKSLKFFCENDDDYGTSLPFQVSNVWSVREGLLIERIVKPPPTDLSKTPRKDQQSANLPVLFSLLHPLDEVAPVICRTGGASVLAKISYVTEVSQHIVYTNEDPPIAVTYDSNLGIHSIWMTRRSTIEEIRSVCVNATSNLPSASHHLTTDLDGTSAPSRSAASGLAKISYSTQSPSFSPLRSFNSKLNSPSVSFGISSKLISPAPSNSFVGNSITHSHQFSPLPHSGLHRNVTPNYGKSSPVHLSRTPVSQTTATAYDQSGYSETVEPLAPDVCLDHLWTEGALLQRDGAVTKAVKVFITSDYCGQHYICYLVLSRHQLRCVKYETSNDGSQLIFGSMSVLLAKDAVTLKAASMMVLLDVSGSLHLYSGLTKLTTILVLSLCLPMSVSSPRTSGRFEEAEPAAIEEDGPKTSSRPSSALCGRFDDEVALLSPVPSENSNSSQILNNSLGVGELSFDGDGPPNQRQTRILHIMESSGNRFIMELNDGMYHSGSVPVPFSSSLVGRSLDAVKSVLPREIMMQVYVGWYNHCHGPGSNDGFREWDMFCRFLLGMIGYDETAMTCLLKTSEPVDLSNYSVTKKAKLSDNGDDEHWQYLTSSRHQALVSRHQDHLLGLSAITVTSNALDIQQGNVSVDSNAILFSLMPYIFLALHLLYEDLKLSHVPNEDVEDLVNLLYMLSRDLRCQRYSEYYQREFSSLMFNSRSSNVVPIDQLQLPQLLSVSPPNIFYWICDLIRGRECHPYPYLPAVNETTRDIIAMFVAMFGDEPPKDITWSRYLRKMTITGHRAPDVEVLLQKRFSALTAASGPFEKVLLLAVQMGDGFFHQLACSVAQPLLEAIYQCRQQPKCDWPMQAYNLIGRQDLAMQCSSKYFLKRRRKVSPASETDRVKDEDDGMEHIDIELMRFRFPDDLRENEIRRLLQSSRPVKISLTQGHGVSDHDFIEEQERQLYATCIRTMALPVGRGIYTLATEHPLLTETLPVPKLCLTGKSSQQRMTTIDLTHIDTPANMNHWALFHNGCAAGLKIAPDSQLPANWIVYNKPGYELTNEHAGFILGLGLNGHLAHLSSQTIHDYLSQSHEMTTIALLLGLAASNRCTMDVTTTRALCVHIPALLPVTSVDLDVPHCVQVAAVMGLGLVYQGTAHCHFAEVLLNEIGRPTCAETDMCTDRQSYSLASGLALGMVMLGKGETLELADLRITDRLRHYMVGGAKLPSNGIYRDRFKSPSTLIKEGDLMNVDVTGAGATLALGLMYFNTENKVIANWLAASNTMFLLDRIRADLLMLRVISESLVMWDYVHPSEQWILSHMPDIVLKYAFKKAEYADVEVDFELINQVYCNILAGACFAMGLKFAGSGNQQAYKCLLEMVYKMDRCLLTFSLVEQTGNGKSTLEACLVVMVLAVALVMAGTCDLEILRLCRRLRARVGPAFGHVVYGSHMAISMAVGLLLIGGGRYTLSNQPKAIASLLVALFPKFPVHSNDNRYHLQALRHFYVLAAEPRLVIPRDVDSGQVCYVPMQITLKDSDYYTNISYDVMAPCLLPELSSIKEVIITGPRYWSTSFHADKNWSKFRKLLATSGVMFVKRRSNYLPYSEDPKGFHSQQLQYSLVDQAAGKRKKEYEKMVKQANTADNIVSLYSELFFAASSRFVQEQPILRFISRFLTDAVGKEKTGAMASSLYLNKVSDLCLQNRFTLGLHQLKLFTAFYSELRRRNYIECEGGLISHSYLLYLINKVEHALDSSLISKDDKQMAQNYIQKLFINHASTENQTQSLGDSLILSQMETNVAHNNSTRMNNAASDAISDAVSGGCVLSETHENLFTELNPLTTSQAQYLASFFTWYRIPYTHSVKSSKHETSIMHLYKSLMETGMEITDILALNKLLL